MHGQRRRIKFAKLSNWPFPPICIDTTYKRNFISKNICRKRYICEKEIYMLTDHVKSPATNPNLPLREKLTHTKKIKHCEIFNIHVMKVSENTDFNVHSEKK